MTDKLSRNALELVATFAAGGIALNRPQQAAIGKLCRAAATIKRCAEAECNGPTNYGGGSVFLSPEGWQQWQAQLNKRKAAYTRAIRQHMTALEPYVVNVRIGGDPRGATVKLVMDKDHERLHDDWGREGICVPGS